MSKLAARKKRVKRTVSIGNVAPEAVEQVADLNGRIEAIQWLIPLGSGSGLGGVAKSGD